LQIPDKAIVNSYTKFHTGRERVRQLIEASFLVMSPGDGVPFHKPRGLRFGPDGLLYCVARDTVIAFDFETGQCVGVTVEFPDLHGQGLIFYPD
jgi:hypothetical protein